MTAGQTHGSPKVSIILHRARSVYDFTTGNGKISIPKEIEDYKTIKAEIIKNAATYKLKLTENTNA